MLFSELCDIMVHKITFLGCRSGASPQSPPPGSAPGSDLRHSWIPPQCTWTSPPAAEYFRSRAEHTALGVLKDTIPQFFSADFRSCLVALSRKSIKCVLKTLLRRSTYAVPIRPQKSNGSSCSSQQWHPRRRVYNCLSNSYRPGLSKIFGRGPHKLLQNSSRAGDLAWCYFFRICYILPNQHIFRKYIIFSLLAKCIAPRWNGFTGRNWPASRYVESRNIDRRAVTAHTIAWVQHQRWTVVIYLRRHGHNVLSRNTVTWRPARDTSQHRTSTKPTEPFTRNPAICFPYFPYFPEVDKTCLYFFGMLPRFLENLLKSRNLFCSATAATKTTLVSSSFVSFIFVASWHALFLGD